MVQGLISKSLFILLLATQAANAQTIVQKWKISMGGLNAAKAFLTFGTTPDHYDIRLAARMAGPLSMAFSWDNRSESTGTLHGGDAIPARHSVNNTWQEETSRFTLSYSESGLLLSRIDTPPLKNALPPLDPNIVDGTRDFLSALIAGGLFLSKNEKCPQSMPVHDGRRRYDITITDAGVERIGKKPARRCRMDIAPFVPEGSKRPKGWFWKRNGKDRKPNPVDIWMAEEKSLGISLPVKCAFTSDFGNVEMILESQETALP